MPRHDKPFYNEEWRVTKKALKISLTCCASFLILVFVFGPREPVRLGTGHDKIMIGDDIDAYLAKREGQFDDIIDGVEKQVIWAGEANVKTVSYTHLTLPTKRIV